MHSEYRDPKPLPGERPVPSIKIDALKLLGLLLRAELMMTAVDRRRYANRAIEASKKWARFVRFNWDRLCFQAAPGFSHNEILQREYHFKLHKNGKAGTTQRFGVAAA